MVYGMGHANEVRARSTVRCGSAHRKMALRHHKRRPFSQKGRNERLDFFSFLIFFVLKWKALFFFLWENERLYKCIMRIEV